MRKQKAAGILLIAAAVLIAGHAVRQGVSGEKKHAEETLMEPKTWEETADQELEEDAEVETDGAEETEGTGEGSRGEPTAFEIRNLPDAWLELMGTDQETLAGLLEGWLSGNQDYASASGVEFYDTCAYDQVEGKYTFTMRTLAGSGYEEESRILALDYYMEDGQIYIHP